MDAHTVAKNYLAHLEKGDMEAVIGLFSANGLVQSPLYGLQKAKTFYTLLAKDTQASKLVLKGIFNEHQGQRIVILFTYHWTLKSGVQISFEVVDILTLNTALQIEKLTIVYDTEQTRKHISFAGL